MVATVGRLSRNARRKSNQPPPQSPFLSMNLAGRIWICFLGLCLIGAGTIFVNYLWGAYQRATLMDSWVESEAEVKVSKVADGGFDQRGLPKYRHELSYRYSFKGENYEGNQARRLPTESSELKKVKKYVDRYPAPSIRPVWINPTNPAQSVLKKDTKASLYSIWFPCLFVIGGVGMIANAIFRRPKAG